ncbi:Rieske 2Fe-2S domain-containing protein [Trinickia violacea]|uniref:Rieske 2Fe-2S domain-containing protein n=1 Tax=Trinickia violacea TaxID=2571746 RepID=A0A4P8ILP5_9BURK|nr:Rieske 2Fe-2S domain-containing protein [Trinickia violacea]QCP49842.1 Rieske 2Fe-2S domain-containing protein [Trinickia violacea]
MREQSEVRSSSPYRDDPGAIRALFDDDRVHRDVYLDEALFELECERLFARSWVYVGHESQVPKSGDFITTSIAGQPLVMVRQADGSVRVLLNRCAHKGAMLVSAPSGNVGKFFRCPYHAWTYRTDGKPLAVPLRAGYEGTRLEACESSRGLESVSTSTYRGFVFARLARDGVAFEAYFGDVLKVLDNLADRSPAGELRVAGGVFRSVMNCNWKMYVENVVDAVHPISTHESAWQTARDMSQTWEHDEPKPVALEQLLPFGSSYDFYQQAGARVFAHGHCILGTQSSIHTGQGLPPGYREALAAAHGESRAAEILAFAPQNSMLFPTLAIKSTPQTMRVIRPLAVNRTLVEIFALEPIGAPAEMLQRTLSYNRLVFSPMSVVAHDDIQVFETMQAALAARGNPWVSLHREHRSDEKQDAPVDVSGNNEILMRNLFRSWVELMQRRPDGSSERAREHCNELA